MAADNLSLEETTMNVLLTGGAGFIGSHTAVELIVAGHGGRDRRRSEQQLGFGDRTGE